MFLVGAAYFVAGSYPESLTLADLDSQHSMHLSTGATVHGTVGGVSAGSASATGGVGGVNGLSDVELGHSGKNPVHS